MQQQQPPPIANVLRVAENGYDLKVCNEKKPTYTNTSARKYFCGVSVEVASNRYSVTHAAALAIVLYVAESGYDLADMI